MASSSQPSPPTQQSPLRRAAYIYIQPPWKTHGTNNSSTPEQTKGSGTVLSLAFSWSEIEGREERKKEEGFMIKPS